MGASEIDLLLELPRTNKTAAKLGLDFFFTNKPCVRGHLTKRYVKGGNCIECVRERKGTTFRRDYMNAANAELAVASLDDGRSTFMANKPCKNGHYERYASSGNCVECGLAAMRRDKEKNRLRRFQKEYGLTPEGLAALQDASDGKCAICGDKHDDLRKMHVDHCHETLKVRGLLCGKCNQGIGLFLHSTERMEAAIAYLHRHASC